jgi:hypothetical protein
MNENRLKNRSHRRRQTVDAQFSDWWCGTLVGSLVQVLQVRICLHNEEDSRIEETGGEPAGPLRCLSQYFLESNEKTTKA